MNDEPSSRSNVEHQSVLAINTEEITFNAISQASTSGPQASTSVTQASTSGSGFSLNLNNPGAGTMNSKNIGNTVTYNIVGFSTYPPGDVLIKSQTQTNGPLAFNTKRGKSILIYDFRDVSLNANIYD
jgi:hypothetical protein